MATDRFSKFKRVNWDNNWKATGSKISGTLLSKSPKKSIRYPESQELLVKLFDQLYHNLNDWERQFMISITESKFLLSVKQKQVLEKIYNKYSKKSKLIKIENFFQF
jgi:hypothetical protein